MTSHPQEDRHFEQVFSPRNYQNNTSLPSARNPGAQEISFTKQDKMMSTPPLHQQQRDGESQEEPAENLNEFHTQEFLPRTKEPESALALDYLTTQIQPLQLAERRDHLPLDGWPL